MAKAKVATTKDVELNRWCIEMAMRWPVISYGGYGNADAYGSGMPPSQTDADIISRAAKIISWIRQSH